MIIDTFGLRKNPATGKYEGALIFREWGGDMTVVVPDGLGLGNYRALDPAQSVQYFGSPFRHGSDGEELGLILKAQTPESIASVNAAASANATERERLKARLEDAEAERDALTQLTRS